MIETAATNNMELSLQEHKYIREKQKSPISTDFTNEDDNNQFLNSFLDTLENRDVYTKNHSQNVARLAVTIGYIYGFSAQKILELQNGGVLHDIGKVAISYRILNKPEKLTPEEFMIIRSHPIYGAQMISEKAQHANIRDAVLHHHEWYNGMGYPNGLKGNEIPLDARIMSVADVYDAMTSNRPYREGMSQEAAMDELIKQKEIQFDPECVDALLQHLDNKPAIFETRYIQ